MKAINGGGDDVELSQEENNDHEDKVQGALVDSLVD